MTQHTLYEKGKAKQSYEYEAGSVWPQTMTNVSALSTQPQGHKMLNCYK